MARQFGGSDESNIDKWNRMLGRRLGRTYTGAPRVSIPSYASGAQQRINRVSRGAAGIPSALVRNYRRASVPSAGGAQYGSTAVQNIWNRTLQDLNTDFAQNANEMVAVENAAAAREPSPDRPWYQDIWHAISGIGGEGEEGGFADSIVGRGLDIASRPAYGLFEGLQTVAEQEDQTGFSPQDLWNTVQNFGAGVGRGLTGEDKTGFGQVYEAYKNNPTTALGPTLQRFEQLHPGAESWLSRGIGFAGELGLDPLNYALPAAPRVIGAGEHAGEVATEAILRDLNVNAAGRVADEFAATSHLATPMYRNNPTLLTNRVSSAIDDLFSHSVANVASGGSPGVRLMNERTWPVTVANRVQTEIETAFQKPFFEHVDHLLKYGKADGIYSARVLAARKYNQDFDDFWRGLEDVLISKGNPNPSMDDVLSAIETGRISRSTIDSVVRNVVKKYEPEMRNVREQVFSDVSNPSYRTVGIRLGNKVVPFKAVGRAYQWLNNKTMAKLFHGTGEFAERSIFESSFPGVFGLKTGMARAVGFSSMDAFRREMQTMARKFSKDEAREMQRLLEEGIMHTGDTRIDEGLKFIREHYDNMFREEQVAGARPIQEIGRKVQPTGSERLDNYVYVYNRGGSRRNRSIFKKGRKADINKAGITGAGRWTMAEAKRMGLRPVDNAFEALFLRKMKSQRDFVRSWFLQDLVKNYSIAGGDAVRRLHPRVVASRGLHEVPYDWLELGLKKMAGSAKARKFYLPEEIWQIGERFNKMTGWTSAEWPALGRAFASTITKLKAMLTLPFTGFHMKNFIGDVFMGLMDDINPRAYERVVRKFLLDSSGHVQSFDIIPGHLNIPFKEMVNEYKRYADSGFFEVEFGTYNSITAGQIPKRITRGTVNAVRQASDFREFAPRLVHFTEAYTQEARALWRSGMRDMAEIQRRSGEAALWRVNKYKFDYSALMPWEKVAKTLAFPFYTYLRKALPTLVESMFLNPHYLSTADRILQYNDGSGADDFNQMNWPQWMKDLGFAQLTDEKEPWAITSDLLPMGALDILSSIRPDATESIQDFSREALSNLNPIVQGPLEMGTGRELFGNRPTSDNALEYFLSQLPLLSDINQEVVDIPGVPGGVTDKSWMERIINERLLGLGMPIRKVTTEMQSQQQQENRDRLIDEPLQQFNYSQDRYTITQAEAPDGSFIYRIRDNLVEGDEGVVALAKTPTEALSIASRLPGVNYQQQYVDPYHQPNMDDVIRQLGG